MAVFALTRGGAIQALRVLAVTGGELWLPASLQDEPDRVAVGLSTPAADAAVHRFAHVGPALREAFAASRALVCVMATGVVVRSLAAALESKYVDPAVLVMDEAGRYVVPLLSGHLGGANALALRIADRLGSQAVITTSSDVQGKLGPDLLAALLGAHVADRRRLLSVAAALANGETVDLWVERDEVGDGTAVYLEGLAGYRVRDLRDAPLEGIAGPAVLVTARLAAEVSAGGSATATGPPAPPVATGADVLWLVPRMVVAGVGCKRDMDAPSLLAAVTAALREAALHPAALRALATAEAKRGEAGLHETAAALGVPLVVASDEQVRAVMAAHGLAENPWVQENVGVGGVSEPAALWAAGSGATLILEKRAGGGVTVALARVPMSDVVATGAAAPEGMTNDPAAVAGTGGSTA